MIEEYQRAEGIHSLDDAMRMIDAGANRLGVRVAVEIIEEYRRAEGGNASDRD